MATYGYSTPYTGRGDIGPLPPGYMEAATAPGRNLAMGIAAMGQNIGQAIERYRTKKAETEAADMSRETLVGLYQQQLASDPKYIAIQQYTETGQLPPGVTEQDIPRYTAQVQADREMLNKFSDVLGDKFVDMSLAKKKAALGDAVMVLNQYRTNQQNELRDAAARQQLALGQLQLEDILEKRKQQGIITEAIKYGLEQPTTTTQTQQVTDTIEFPPMPGTPTPAVQATPSQAEATAARYFMSRYGQAAQDLAKYGTDLGRRAEALNVSPTVAPQPADSAYKIFGAAFQGLGSPLSIPPTGISRPDYETQIQAAARAEANARLRQQQLAESQTALQQAGIMAKSPALQTVGPRTLQPEQPAQMIQQPAQTITRNVSTQVPISYEDQSKRLTQYLIQQGARPETIAMVPQILETVGQRRPIQVESQTLPSGITVVRADGKVDILPAPKMVEGKELTEGQANSLGFASRMMLNEGTINDVIARGYRPGGLTEFGFTPERLKTDDRKTYEAAKENWIAAALRKESGAAIGKEEYAAADRQYFPQPGDSEKVLKQKANLRSTVFKTMKAGIGRFADDYLRQVGADQGTMQQPQSALLSDPRVAAIRARQASGAITKQQAIQQIESLK